MISTARRVLTRSRRVDQIQFPGRFFHSGREKTLIGVSMKSTHHAEQLIALTSGYPMKVGMNETHE